MRSIKVSVNQYGARRRYLIPIIFEQAGLLQHLFTDSYCNSLLGKFCGILIKCGLTNSNIQRLSKRCPSIPTSKILANDFWQIKCILSRLLHFPHETIIKTIFHGGAFTITRRKIKKSDWLYTMFIENIHLVRYAHNHHVKVLADIYENPFIFSELSSELVTNPEYRSILHLKTLYESHADFRHRHIDELLKLADVYLIPSEYVKESLKQSPAFDIKKAHVLPYISSVPNKEYRNNPIKGRIIWIGNDPVRKGLVYALRAFRQIKQKHPFSELVVIGPLPTELKNDTYFKDVTFTGYLNKNQLIEEFNKADMYVFPTLAEGFAGSVLEAAAYGVPIITTHASGFDENAPCLFVDTKRSDQIVDAIELLLNNRDIRNKYSSDIFQFSKSFNQNDFAEKLISLIKSNS